MVNILIIEDDLAMRKYLSILLETNGFTVHTAGDGLEALDLMDTQSVDLIVSDVMMPNMDGFEFTRTVREANYDLPILMLTAKSYIDDKKIGFSAGTDDYMTKPVDEEELILRINALLRRSQISKSRQIKLGSILIDQDSMTVTDSDTVHELPPKEFSLLYKLLSSPGKIFTRMQIMDDVWGMDSEADDVTINVHINRLRRRFEHLREFEIVTVRGLGYKAVKHES